MLITRDHIYWSTIPYSPQSVWPWSTFKDPSVHGKFLTKLYPNQGTYSGQLPHISANLYGPGVRFYHLGVHGKFHTIM